MIALVSSNVRERSALAALCEQRCWPHAACDSLRSLRKLLQQSKLQIVVTRNRLDDGYSDDVLALMADRRAPGSRIIVLYPADLPATQAARQISLGADCVLRDPVRTDVLAAYLSRYASAPAPVPTGRTRPRLLRFAGGLIDPVARTVGHAGQHASLTPREIELIQLLTETKGTLVSYQTLYSEILGRPFRGDTSNMRVLLGKLDKSFRSVGIALREYVAVIPKAGYRCRQGARSSLRIERGQPARQPSAA